jgi:carbon-monoxide dehydrogenase large subunit
MVAVTFSYATGTVFARHCRPTGTARRALCATHVRHGGDPVALSVAETAVACLDAAERLVLDLDELPAVVDPASAPDAPTTWPEAPRNIASDWEAGDINAVEAALARAAHRVELPLVNNRIAVSPLEPRARTRRGGAAAGPRPDRAAPQRCRRDRATRRPSVA